LHSEVKGGKFNIDYDKMIANIEASNPTTDQLRAFLKRVDKLHDAGKINGELVYYDIQKSPKLSRMIDAEATAIIDKDYNR
jgi:hypothetical protein